MNVLEQTIYTYLTQDMNCDKQGSEINAKRLCNQLQDPLIKGLSECTTYHVGGRQYVSRDDVIRLIKEGVL